MIVRHVACLPLLLPPLLLFSALVGAADAELDVRIRPPNNELEANVEAHIGDLGERDADALRGFKAIAEQQADRALQALGYYRSEISSEVIEGSPPTLRLRIETGEPVRLDEVVIEVEGEASRLDAFRVPQPPALRSGAVLDHGAYEDAKKLIENQALRYGFFSGHFSAHEIRIDPQAGTADIRLIYQSGPRFSLGEVSFNGDIPLKDGLLRRMVPFAAGTPYDTELIAELSNDLRASGYFEEVMVEADPQAAVDQRIPVTVTLTPREPRSLGVGLGYSTDVGPRARATWTRHWVNPEGHRLGAELVLSEPRQQVGAWYEVPLDPPLSDRLRFSSGYQFERLGDIESRHFNMLGQRQTDLDNGWQRNLSLRWEREWYRIDEDSGISNFILPGIGYGVVRSDNNLDPANGYRLQADLAVAKQELLSDADLLHITALAKGLTTLDGGHRLLGRVQVGAIATDDYSAIPPSLRFFAGGDQSVRGYDYESLSPEDRDGDKVGGRYLLAFSAEYQYPIRERWRLATFIDHGNAVDSFSDPLMTGVGIGVRWVSPVGPLRLDLAHALDGDGGFRLHFSMGPEL